MNGISRETIEIDGKEYKLFLNRDGIVAWELYSNKEKAQVREQYNELKPLMSKFTDEKIIESETNPIENAKKVSEINDEDARAIELYKKLYWIMLSTDQKMTYKEASELIDKAIKEYGAEQIILLGVQMLQDANTDKFKNNDIKNLPALRQKR